MYQHWGLRCSPFAGRRTPLFYEGESQTEALARLRFTVAERRSALVLGGQGVGKSLLFSEFARACRRAGRDVAAISLAGLSQREVLWRLASQLSLGPGADEDAVRLFRRVGDYGAATRWRNARAVLLLDDVDLAGPDVQTVLVRLASGGAGRSAWLSLIMTAAPGQTSRLAGGLLDAIDLRIDLPPWSESETVGYVQHALLDAGRDRPIFEDEAISVLFVLSDGVPRRVNRLADHALIAAAAQGLDLVDAGVVEQAQEAVAWTATA